MEETPHIAILPSPGIGHLNPLVAFAKQLVLLHNYSVTFTVPNYDSLPDTEKKVLHDLPHNINSLFLPPINLSDELTAAKQLVLTMTNSLYSLGKTIELLKSTTRLVAFIVDPFGVDAINIVKQLKIATYIFFPASAMSLSLFFCFPKLDETISCDIKDLIEPINLPGCIPLRGRDVIEPFQERKNPFYSFLLNIAKGCKLADGILINTFMNLEYGALKALMVEEPGKPLVYPVGPLIQTSSVDGVDGSTSDCLRWLDDQPSASVLFISFGSGGTLSYEQVHELALGLEESEQRFLWITRSPNDEVSDGAYLSAKSHKDPLDFLPNGFLDRTKGMGLVVPNWAPQIQVLSHGSTGGFITHCGWNSTLESVTHGVPLIAWPLYAEQKMNAEFLVKDAKVALRPKAKENGVIGRGEIATVVKRLMQVEEGKVLRNRMRDLKDAAAKVSSKDGSSTKSLADFALKWNNVENM